MASPSRSPTDFSAAASAEIIAAPLCVTVPSVGAKADVAGKEMDR